MWRSGFKWLFLILGTMIGAGYASGRELWQFFGHESVLAILLFTILFIISCAVIMVMSYEKQSSDYIPILEHLVGKKLTHLYDVMIIFYLFTTTLIMLAGGGATLEAVDIPYWTGITIMSTLVVGIFLWDIRGILTVNSLTIPVLMILLFTTLVLFLYHQDVHLFFDWHRQRNWPSAITFTSLNILPILAVMSAIGKEIKHRGEIWIASIGSGLILGGISLLYNESLLSVSTELVFYEIPLFAILKHYPYMMFVIMSVLLWLSIYTTAVSSLFGLMSRFQEVINARWSLMALFFVLIMLPLTSVGFSTLIAVIYPIYGVLNLYLLASILLYPIAK